MLWACAEEGYWGWSHKGGGRKRKVKEEVSGCGEGRKTGRDMQRTV